MTTGTGLVLLGVWVMVAAAFHAKSVSGLGVWIAIIVGIAMTVYLK